MILHFSFLFYSLVVSGYTVNTPNPIALSENASFTELGLQFARYYSEAASYMAQREVAVAGFSNKIPGSVEIIDDDTVDYNQVIQYLLAKRNSLTSQLVHQIVSYNPKATIYFEDTQTVFVPDLLTLNSTRQALKQRLTSGATFLFFEVDVSNATFGYEDTWFPASPCLEFAENDNSSTGSLKMNYCAGAELDINNAVNSKAERTYYNVSLLMSSTTSLTIGKSMKFCGLHSCSTSNGNSIRMLYRPHTVTVTPKMRQWSHNVKSKSLHNLSEWVEGLAEKYFTDAWSLFSCASQKYVDLHCNSPGIEYKDSMGNTFKSIDRDNFH